MPKSYWKLRGWGLCALLLEAPLKNANFNNITFFFMIPLWLDCEKHLCGLGAQLQLTSVDFVCLTTKCNFQNPTLGDESGNSFVQCFPCNKSTDRWTQFTEIHGCNPWISGRQWPLNKILGDELRPNHSPMTRMNSESPKTEGKIKGLSFLLHNHLYYFHNKHRKLQPPVSYKCTDPQGEMTSYHK